MHDTRTRPIAKTLGAIPELRDMQESLARAFLTAAKRNKVRPVLSSWYQTPRLGFDLAKSKATHVFLQVLHGDGWSFQNADTGTSLSANDLKAPIKELPEHLFIYLPTLIGGRMIHGAYSGLRLALHAKESPKKSVVFPTAVLRDQSANDMLAGIKGHVRRDALERFSESKIPDHVDIVYTWVDDADPHWQARRRMHRPDDPSADAEDAARFNNNNELLYSLRSLFRYFVGIGRVYLVTDAQIPDFLDEFDGRVTVIDHSDIMGPNVARPVFNSHVIESCLHHIDGLAPQYLYLNDDFLFAKPTCPADFFTHEGHSKAFFSNRAYIPKGKITRDTLAVDAAAINLRNLLKNRFDHVITRKFQHAPVAIHRDVMFELEDVFPKQFARLHQNRFRSKTDLSPSGSLYLHYALMIERAVPAKIQYRYYDTASNALPLKLLKLSCESDRQRPKVHCINSTGDRPIGWFKAKSMQHQLSELYPSANTKRRHNTWLDTIRFRVIQHVLALRSSYRRKARKRARRVKS